MKQDEAQGVSQLLERYSSGVIILPSNAPEDTIAAGTSLYLGLTKAGKNVSLVSASPLKSNLTGADKITTELATSGNNLVISFPYADGSIDKVDYNITGDRFNLIVTPRTPESAIDPKDVTFAKSGGTIEFAIVLDTPSLKSLGALYTQNQDLFAKSAIINIDRHLSNTFYGTANLVSKSSSSLCEIAFGLLQGLKVEMDADIATNLYRGLLAATNNFTSYSVTPESMEAAAQLLRAGAKRGATSAKKGTFSPTSRPAPQISKPANHKEARALETIEPEDNDDEDDIESDDWLKPKIFGETKN